MIFCLIDLDETWQEVRNY